jgi:hypothetical protein
LRHIREQRHSTWKGVSSASLGYPWLAEIQRLLPGEGTKSPSVGEAILLTAVSLALTAISLKLQKLLDAFDCQLIEVNYRMVE